MNPEEIKRLRDLKRIADEEFTTRGCWAVDADGLSSETRYRRAMLNAAPDLLDALEKAGTEIERLNFDRGVLLFERDAALAAVAQWKEKIKQRLKRCEPPADFMFWLGTVLQNRDGK